ncbi:chemotaxis protein CheW [Thermobrachium celere]|uniref:Chemotaxis signal transduction protein CheW n=2 Tax=Thermobrachium celere DSM 8682 TaxID=941824 RepID=R7RRZ9_9CLOT|nr:chemotaxis protein CheW [Thermobrachium celere]CDF58038.1 chemotaxis signal transduction protein CheW [Thermobrachium celere DSM 8682]
MQVVIFNIGKEKYALETRIVHGIEKMMNITKVPTAPYYVSGLANLRGNIISVIDLKKYLNIISNNQCENIIIVEVKDEKIGLMVDSVQEVVDVEDEIIEKINNDNNLIKGVINFKEYIVTLIDGENLLK